MGNNSSVLRTVNSKGTLIKKSKKLVDFLEENRVEKEMAAKAVGAEDLSDINSTYNVDDISDEVEESWYNGEEWAEEEWLESADDGVENIKQFEVYDDEEFSDFNTEYNIYDSELDDEWTNEEWDNNGWEEDTNSDKINSTDNSINNTIKVVNMIDSRLSEQESDNMGTGFEDEWLDEEWENQGWEEMKDEDDSEIDIDEEWLEEDADEDIDEDEWEDEEWENHGWEIVVGTDDINRLAGLDNTGTDNSINKENLSNSNYNNQDISDIFDELGTKDGFGEFGMANEWPFKDNSNMKVLNIQNNGRKLYTNVRYEYNDLYRGLFSRVVNNFNHVAYSQFAFEFIGASNKDGGKINTKKSEPSEYGIIQVWDRSIASSLENPELDKLCRLDFIIKDNKVYMWIRHNSNKIVYNEETEEVAISPLIKTTC